MTDTQGSSPLVLRPSATFPPETVAHIQSMSRTGRYEIRGWGAKRKVPSFDDLTFVTASLSRYPLEGYRERCETRTVLGGLLVAGAMGRPLGAQGSVVDVGLSAVSFKEDKTSVFGPWLRVTLSGKDGPFFGSVSGAGVATVGAASGSASVVGGVRELLGRGVFGELAGEVATVAGTSANGGVGTSVLSGRAVWSNRDAGAWFKSAGHVGDRANSTQRGLGFESGGWWTWSRTQVIASLTQQWSGAELYTLPFRKGFAGTTPVRYSEAAITVHRENDWSSFEYSTTARRDPDAAQLLERAQSVTLAVWRSNTMAVLFSASRQLPDFVRGADASDAVSVGLRGGEFRPAIRTEARQGVLASIANGADGQLLRVSAIGARSVDVMADFTDWSIRSLTRVGDHFESIVSATSGSHRMLVRINDGAWRLAANTPAVDDDFGGKAGLLVVP